VIEERFDLENTFDAAAYLDIQGACIRSLDWLRQQESPRLAWETTYYAHWMMWAAVRRPIDIRILLQVAHDCTLPVVEHLVHASDVRPRQALALVQHYVHTPNCATEPIQRAADDAYAMMQEHTDYNTMLFHAAGAAYYTAAGVAERTALPTAIHCAAMAHTYIRPTNDTFTGLKVMADTIRKHISFDMLIGGAP
jgi:hypothetical protein